MIANSVVLPAPFGPISAVMRPVCAANDAPVDREQAAEPLRDVLDPQQRPHPWPRSGERRRRRRSATTPAMPRGANATTRIRTLP